MTSNFNLQWAAGLFEGEGSFSVRTDSQYGYQRPIAQIKSTDEDVLITFRQVVMIGNLRGPYGHKKNNNWKQYWHWEVSKVNDYLFFCHLVYPYMHSRRQEKMIEVAQICKVDLQVAARR